jgi:hypothetical protein
MSYEEFLKLRDDIVRDRNNKKNFLLFIPLSKSYSNKPIISFDTFKKVFYRRFEQMLVK